MRLFLRAACAEGGGGRVVLQAPGGGVTFQMQPSFPVSNKHGKCAFEALGPAPTRAAAACPVVLSSALQRGATAHHEVCPAFFLQALLTYSTPPLRDPPPLLSTLSLTGPFLPLLSHSSQCSHLFPWSFQPVPLLHPLHLPLLIPLCLPIPWSHHAFLSPSVSASPLSFTAPFPPSLLHLPLPPRSLPGRASSRKAG